MPDSDESSGVKRDAPPPSESKEMGGGLNGETTNYVIEQLTKISEKVDAVSTKVDYMDAKVKRVKDELVGTLDKPEGLIHRVGDLEKSRSSAVKILWGGGLAILALVIRAAWDIITIGPKR